MEDHNVGEDVPTVYPVPVVDELNIEWNKGFSKIELFDAKGKLVFRAETDKAQNYSIDFSKFASGVYTLKVDDSQAIRIVK